MGYSQNERTLRGGRGEGGQGENLTPKSGMESVNFDQMIEFRFYIPTFINLS